MNGKEKAVLQVIATDIKWMREKQVKHDELLEKIDLRLRQGAGKIAHNRTWIKAISIAISFLATGFLYLVFR